LPTSLSSILFPYTTLFRSSTCKEIIEKHNGVINKYLGDGFLAYWPDAETKPEEIAAVICALKELQQKNTPDFRIVVHFGSVAIRSEEHTSELQSLAYLVCR